MHYRGFAWLCIGFGHALNWLCVGFRARLHPKIELVWGQFWDRTRRSAARLTPLADDLGSAAGMTPLKLPLAVQPKMYKSHGRSRNTYIFGLHTLHCTCKCPMDSNRPVNQNRSKSIGFCIIFENVDGVKEAKNRFPTPSGLVQYANLWPWPGHGFASKTNVFCTIPLFRTDVNVAA